MKYLARLEQSRWRKGLAALTAAGFVGITLGYYFLGGALAQGRYPGAETLLLFFLPLGRWLAFGVVGGLLFLPKKRWLGSGLLLGVGVIVLLLGVWACAVLANVH